MSDIGWLTNSIAPLYKEDRRQAGVRQASLTKPAGALGRLETIIPDLAAMQGYECPEMNEIFITIFAADHGVAANGVSAYPQAVTGEMIKNFSRGGAAINVLARELGAQLEVVNLGTVSSLLPLKGVLDMQLGFGTKNLCIEPAMSEDQLGKALMAGRDAASRATLRDAHLFIGGEMGIGNTTSATALACALLNLPPADLAGPGTGLDAAGVIRKIDILQQALQRHEVSLNDPLKSLHCLGGFEIAALVGAYIGCAQAGLPVLVDGYTSSVAALMATKLSSQSDNWFLYSHRSAEPGHKLVLEALHAEPLLDLGMRLGEGSGAAVVVPLLRAACALHAQMATFEEAGISEKGA
ncbi:MAG: nicotinate-nucleotide--dimethylbenzimidazole phosphoribosyltransferase [bacterium]|nr:nicotinate-nucleotide--dimethylbenzimidazole phosphoribosyltransferase [bacterium]